MNKKRAGSNYGRKKIQCTMTKEQLDRFDEEQKDGLDSSLDSDELNFEMRDYVKGESFAGENKDELGSTGKYEIGTPLPMTTDWSSYEGMGVD